MPNNQDSEDEQGYLMPPQDHIDVALEVEKSVGEADMELYLECMDGKPMSERVGARSIRDGCILTHHVYLFIKKRKDQESR